MKRERFEIVFDTEIVLSLLTKGETLNLNELKIISYILHRRNIHLTPATISDISRDTNLDYNNTHRYIQKLKNKNIIVLNPPTYSQGKKVFVEYNEKFDRIFPNNKEYGFILKDQKEPPKNLTSS